MVRNAIARPLLQRGRKRLVHRLLGAVEVAEHANQRRQHAPRFLAPDGFDACLHGTITARQSSTIGLKPPQNIRLPSNGIFFGSMNFFHFGSDMNIFMAFLLMRSRWLFVR